MSSFVIIILFIWFIVTLFIPKKTAPFFKTKPRMKAFFVTLVALVAISIAFPAENTSSSSSSKSADKVTTSQTKEDKAAKADAANTDAMRILGGVPQFYDQVEKTTAYLTWGAKEYPADTNLYWYAIVKDKDVNERLKMVHFSTGFEWVFWDKLIFSTDQGKWEYTIGSFAGQSGNGKSTQIVTGGKYETLDIPYDKLKPGIELLINGTNPIIRLQGKEYKYDFQVPSATIEQMKLANQLNNDLKVLDNKLK